MDKTITCLIAMVLFFMFIGIVSTVAPDNFSQVQIDKAVGVCNGLKFLYVDDNLFSVTVHCEGGLSLDLNKNDFYTYEGRPFPNTAVVE